MSMIRGWGRAPTMGWLAYLALVLSLFAGEPVYAKKARGKARAAPTANETAFDSATEGSDSEPQTSRVGGARNSPATADSATSGDVETSPAQDATATSEGSDIGGAEVAASDETTAVAGDSAARKIGFGAYLGEPIAISLIHWFVPEFALQLTAGYKFQHSGFASRIDGLYGIPNAIESPLEGSRFDLSLGLGVIVGEEGRPDGRHCHTDPWYRCHTFEDPNPLLLGTHASVTLSWMLEKLNAEFFAEFAPGVRFLPNLGLELSAGLGARTYYGW